MTPRLAFAFAALAAIVAAPAPPRHPSKVAELLGRSPGKPQRCLGIPQGTMFTTEVSDPHLLIYDDGKTVWANQLNSTCDFRLGDSIIADEPASYHCHGDFVRQGKPMGLNPFGRRCTLGDFVPYRKAK